MTLTETLETNPWMFPNTTHLLFPFMNFTCSSNITSLMFVARLGNNLAMPVWEPGPLNLESILSTGPLFYRWHCNHGNDGHCHHYEMMEPLNLDQIYLHEVQDHTLTASRGSTDDQLGLIEMMFETPVIFNENDTLGLLQLESMFSTQGSAIKVLRQRNGYGLTLPCIPDRRNECIPPWAAQPQSLPRAMYQQMPYIAVTGNYY